MHIINIAEILVSGISGCMNMYFIPKGERGGGGGGVINHYTPGIVKCYCLLLQMHWNGKWDVHVYRAKEGFIGQKKRETKWETRSRVIPDTPYVRCVLKKCEDILKPRFFK